MSTKHLLEPELLPLLDAFPPFDFSDDNLPQIRAGFIGTAELGDADAAGVTRSEQQISLHGGESVRCLVYQPKNAAPKRPGYLHIHGGGYIIGAPEGSDPMNLKICGELGVTVVAVSYRLAPEHPIPAPLDDCYSALGWMHENADELGIDTARIGIGGESAGGGLAAALALKARDAGEYAICHQHLTYPMLDDRTGSAEVPGDPLVGEFVWTRESNQFGWSRYLGDAPAAAPQVPARAENLSGLPPTWLLTVGLDLFRDENIEYARRLLAAGVEAELLVYPGGCHAFQALPGTVIGGRYIKDHIHGLKRGLKVDA